MEEITQTAPQNKPSLAGGTTVKLRQETLDRLNSFRHRGQTYDGVIAEILDEYLKLRSK